MKVVSFNTNGIRAREHQLIRLRNVYQPDVIGIQETKVQDPDFPREMIDQLGYKAHYYGQKTHYGVALLSKNEPLKLVKGFPGDDSDAQRWGAKAQRIRALREVLQVLDQRRSVPDDYADLFARLINELGLEAPEVQRWQEKVRALERSFAALAHLDQAVSLAEDVDDALATLGNLVGDDDPVLQRYREKVDQVRLLNGELRELDRLKSEFLSTSP